MYLMESKHLDLFSFECYGFEAKCAINPMSLFRTAHPTCLTFISSSNHLLFAISSKHDILESLSWTFVAITLSSFVKISFYLFQSCLRTHNTNNFIIALFSVGSMYLNKESSYLNQLIRNLQQPLTWYFCFLSKCTIFLPLDDLRNQWCRL